jgi:hypothetical protein
MALLVTASLSSADDKKKSAPTTEQDYQALAQIREVTGKLVSVQPTANTLTLQYEYEYLVAKNKKGGSHGGGQASQLLKQQQKLLQGQQKILASKNRAQATKHLLQLQAHGQNIKPHGGGGGNSPFTISSARKDFDLETVENVNVRLTKLPLEYDDKGNPKKYTAKELEALKGPDTRLPGYASKVDDLKPGQMVKLTFGKSKAAASKTKDAGQDTQDDDHPKVTMIVILQDAEPAKTAANKNDKRK